MKCKQATWPFCSPTPKIPAASHLGDAGVGTGGVHLCAENVTVKGKVRGQGWCCCHYGKFQNPTMAVKMLSVPRQDYCCGMLQKLFTSRTQDSSNPLWETRLLFLISLRRWEDRESPAVLEGAGAAARGITGGTKHHMELLAGGKGKLQNNGNCIPLASCCLFLSPPN